MATFVLGKAAVKAIHKAVGAIFAKAKARLLGRLPTGKAIGVDVRAEIKPELSVTGLFVNASVQEYAHPNEKLLESIHRVTEGYIDTYETFAKTKVVETVDAFLQNASKQNTPIDVEKVLSQELEKVWDKTRIDLERLTSVQTNVAKNVGAVDGIMNTNARMGVEDPVVAFMSVADVHRCLECTKLHCMPDKITPRCWYLSEVKAGYHHRGDENPSLAGLHPNDRCSMVTVLPGYGFDAAGKLQYIGRDHSEIRKQRGG